MPIEKLITYHLPEGMHIISEKDVLGLIRKIKYEIATYEDSRFMMKREGKHMINFLLN